MHNLRRTNSLQQTRKARHSSVTTFNATNLTSFSDILSLYTCPPGERIQIKRCKNIQLLMKVYNKSSILRKKKKAIILSLQNVSQVLDVMV